MDRMERRKEGRKELRMERVNKHSYSNAKYDK